MNVNGLSSGTWQWSKPCDVPVDEVTSLEGPGEIATTHVFFAALLPFSKNFEGRTIVEFGPSSDGCFVPGLGVAEVTSVTGTSANIVEGGYNDTIGFLPNAVTIYRANGRAPCSVISSQSIAIDCSLIPDPAYVTNVLQLRIDTTTVTNTRDGVSGTRTFP